MNPTSNDDEPPAPRRFSPAMRLKSFRYALAGIATLLRTQHNSWIHLAITMLVLVAGWLLRVTMAEWCLLVLAIVLVWVTEAINTAIEELCDVVTLDEHPGIKRAKDLAAAAVLISAVGAVCVGLIVFLPRLVGD